MKLQERVMKIGNMLEEYYYYGLNNMSLKQDVRYEEILHSLVSD